jgi:FkbM family methyltransferase
MSTAAAADLPLVARCLRMILGTRIRGATRLTLTAGWLFPQLRALKVPIGPATEVYVDLRISASHHLLEGILHEDIERELVAAIIKPGDVCWDVGAHFGVYTVLLSKLTGPAGRVFAFEPNTLLLPSLRRTIERLGNVVLLPYAMSDDRGSATLFIPPDFSAASLADWTSSTGRNRRIVVEKRTADELLRAEAVDRPSFIKCDVEGGETLVFRGARELLDRNDAPILLFEINTRASAGFTLQGSSAVDFLLSLPQPRYEVFQFDATQPDVRNVLAVPFSRRDADGLRGFRTL